MRLSNDGLNPGVSYMYGRKWTSPLQHREIGYVLAVGCDRRVHVNDGRTLVRVDEVADWIPHRGWQLHSCGHLRPRDRARDGRRPGGPDRRTSSIGLTRGLAEERASTPAVEALSDSCRDSITAPRIADHHKGTSDRPDARHRMIRGSGLAAPSFSAAMHSSSTVSIA